MARMANISITICDSCKSMERETSTWAIHGPDGSRKMDLCDEHGKALENFLAELAPGVTKTKPRRASKRTTRRPVRDDGFESRVTTIEELKAGKK